VAHHGAFGVPAEAEIDAGLSGMALVHGLLWRIDMHHPGLRTTTLAFAVSLAGGALGCGGSTNEATGSDASARGDDAPAGGDSEGLDAGDAVVPPSDGEASDATGSNSDATPTDAGAFACGEAICNPSQICLYPAYGCVGLRQNDAGACPSGTQPVNGSDLCLPPPPAPSCVSPTPDESYDCSGADVGGDCSLVSAPIPSHCSRICREDCA